MDDDDYSIFWGFGSTHEMRAPEDRPPSRLCGLRSVSNAAERAYRPKAEQPVRHPIGFHRPR